MEGALMGNEAARRSRTSKLPPRYPECPCAECATMFVPRTINQDCCTTKCRVAWRERQRQRGIALLNLIMWARLDREGATGRDWRTRVTTLISNWDRTDRNANGGLGRKSYQKSLVPNDAVWWEPPRRKRAGRAGSRSSNSRAG